MTSSSRPLAVVTGASSGIGRELAKQFAEHDFDVLICAEDNGLESVATELRTHGGQVWTLRADLRTDAGVAALTEAVAGQPVDALALNAGVAGVSGAFVETPWSSDQEVIELNVIGTVHLAKILVPDMVRRGSGRVLFTSSVAATMPGPYYASNAASKSFVQSFAEALRYELKDSGVTITALMPGPTDTNFFDRAEMQDKKVYDAPKDDPAEVAKDGFEALMAGKDHVVAGSIKNNLQTAGAKLMPDTTKAALHAGLTSPKPE